MNKFWLGLLPGEHVDVVKSIMVFSENPSWYIMAYHGIFVSFIDVNPNLRRGNFSKYFPPR